MNVQHHYRYHVVVVPVHEQILDILQVKFFPFKLYLHYRILGQDDSCSFGPCECSLTTCDVCLTERKILH